MVMTKLSRQSIAVGKDDRLQIFEKKMFVSIQFLTIQQGNVFKHFSNFLSQYVHFQLGYTKL